MSTLHLSLLGSPELRHGERILTLPTRKALAVLVYLAVEGGRTRVNASPNYSGRNWMPNMGEPPSSSNVKQLYTHRQ